MGEKINLMPGLEDLNRNEGQDRLPKKNLPTSVEKSTHGLTPEDNISSKRVKDFYQGPENPTRETPNVSPATPTEIPDKAKEDTEQFLKRYEEEQGDKK